MLILHGSWLLPDTDAPARFALWGEVSRPDPPARPRGRRPKPSLDRAGFHPFNATVDELRAALSDLAIECAAEATAVVARLPALSSDPQPSRPFLYDRESSRKPEGKPERKPEDEPVLAAWTVGALALAPFDALALLIDLPADDDATPDVALGADLAFWKGAAGLALELLVSQRFAPALVETERNGRFLALWQPTLDGPEDQARMERLAAAMPPACRALAWDVQQPVPGPRALLDGFVGALVDAGARQGAEEVLLPAAHPGRAKAAPAQAWLAALVAPDPALEVPAPFVKQYREWVQAAHVSGDGGFRICFRLDPPDSPTDDPDTFFVPQAAQRGWSLRYFLQANDDPSLLVPAGVVWQERGSTLRFLNHKFDQPQERLLAGLGYASRVFPPIEASLHSARPEACELDSGQAHAFIREAALLLQASGFGVLLPGLSSKLSVRLKLSPARKQQSTAAKGGVGGLNFQSVVAFDWELALGDQALSAEEFRKLAALKVPLVQVRGQWVELRPEQLQQALDFLQQHQTDGGEGELSLAEALRLALAPERVAGLPLGDVEAEGWVDGLLHDLRDPARVTPLAAPPGFVGRLRPYQQQGFAWLAFLRRYGLGACLADDMGLGKTIQTIALLLHEREQGPARPALLICPTSVVDNWRREVARFAPGLRVMVHHGTAREKDDFARVAAGHDLVISSYALLHRDEPQFAQVAWGDVILDEAQNIKNPSTKQAQAARRLPAEQRIALTGTPVENRLAELWSIFQFLNPGYLGSQQDFQKRFARPIERSADPQPAQRLKALVGPFILRRVKTDPKVISDLPAKNEMKVYCPLTREQATLYEAVVRDSLERIADSEGIERRGLVLSTLMKLKQVCNHPAQFLGDGSALPERSGKLARLAEMLEEVRSVRERALVFTQFAEMGGLLKTHLHATLGGEVLFLHGGTPAKQRPALIARFQEDPHGPAVFVLSIKAGGTGLNLTRANHVFHFDRWWNPAVENQATDRAFRIGQTRNVQVYKFLCAGTVEERIDKMIERKQELAQSIVGSSEAWITELSTEQLRDLFTLRQEG